MDRALILCAGEGARLRPLTLNLPKPMVPIGGRPLLDLTLEHLAAQGVNNFAINLHHQPNAILSYFVDKYLRYSLTYSYEEHLLGSAGAMKKLEWFFPDTFMVVYGDVLSDFSVATMLQAHRESGATATIAVHEVADPAEKGVVVTDHAGRVRTFIEKPGPTLAYGRSVSAGFCVFEPRVFRYLRPGLRADIGPYLFPTLLVHGEPLQAVTLDGYVRDIGSPADLECANRDYQAGRVRLRSAVTIHD